jgi:Ca-activated chloride channel family protein
VDFGHPEFLWLLVLVPLLGLWTYRGRRVRERAWKSLAQRGNVPANRTASMLAAMIFMILALAQPRFGGLIGPEMPPGQDVVLMVDVSRSMGVEDAVPSRLAMAVDAAQSLIKALAAVPSNRAAVVAFAGRGVLRCPLTENLGAVSDTLNRLQPGSVQPGGTDLGSGLDAALDAFGQAEHAEGRAIVVFSDGEDHAESWRSRLDRLTKAGVVVHVVAIGDADQGHPVPTGEDHKPLVYEGEEVRSHRVDTALEAVARQTEGAVLKLGLARANLGTLYRERIAPVAKRKREAWRIPERPERFSLFLAAALGLLIAGCRPGGRLGFRRWIWSRAMLIFCLLTISLAAIGAGQADRDAARQSEPPAPPPTTPPRAQSTGHHSSAAELVASGQSAYGADNLTGALTAFEAAILAAPAQPIPRYNAAAILFQLERYPEALERYQEARSRADVSLRTKIDFALGNTALALGDLAGAVEHYDHCIGSTARGAGLDIVRESAAINRQFALEQANLALASQGESDQDKPESKQKDRSPNARARPKSGNEQTPDDSSDGSPGGQNDDSQAGEDNQPPTKRRRTGGAGGANNAAAGAPGESPDDRLDSAIDQIREAERRRLPEETPSEPAGDRRKDW